MAPPISRRSKENSTIFPSIPLPGIALGLFAALAASFAASRALRKKRPSKSLEDEQQSIYEGDSSFKEKEIEMKERDDSPFLINSNSTITIAQEPSKLAAGNLKPVFDAIHEEVPFVQERDAIPSVEDEDFGEDGESVEAGSGGGFEETENGGETVEKEKTNEEEVEIAEVVVEIEASLAVDDASVKALQSSIRETGRGQGAREAGRKRTEGEDNGVNIVIKDEEICGEGERSSADQQQSPVLINGKKLDFSEDVPDTKDETNLLSSESSSLPGGVSEISVQEVSAPVRPLAPPATEESLEAERPGAKPGLSTDLNQSGEGIGSPDDEKETPIKLGSPSAVIDVKGDSKDSEGKPSIKANGLDEGIAESTTNKTEALSNGSSSPKELDDCESLGECEHAVQSTREVSADDFTGLQDKGENIAERAQINGKNVPLEESPMSADKSNVQKGQEGTDGAKSDAQRNPELLAASELLADKTCVSSKSDHVYDGESADGKSFLECDTSEEGAGAESILEEPKPQPGTQNRDNVDSNTTSDDVELEQEQPNVPVASKGTTKGSELSSEGRFTDNVNREDKDDGLSGELLVKDRSPTKEEEVKMMTVLHEPNDGVCDKKAHTSLMDSAHVTHNHTREADGLLVKGAVHQHGLQRKGVSVSKAFEYLPLEIAFFCLLIALLSYVLWFLEMLPAISQLELAEIY